MTERWDNFPRFIASMQGKRLLHLGHKDADCDALGSAYALSRVLPGAVGCAAGLKDNARDLAAWLDLDVHLDPDPAAYDYTILHDLLKPDLLGMPLPRRYALFDHHEPGGHRNSSLRNGLSEHAEWAWVRPLESSCSLLIDLFQAHAVPIDRKMAVALAAGLLTDTGYLSRAHGPALRRLGRILEPVGLYVEDVLAIIAGPARRASARPSVLAALHNLREHPCRDWNILVAQTDTREHAFTLLDLLTQLGSDVNVIGFPQGAHAMVVSECRQALVDQAGLDLAGLMAHLGQSVAAQETWGTRSQGRIIAPLPVAQATQLCVDSIAQALAN
ncbi:MAG: hypothetical protein AB1894_11060 [Chloroflexota bacterium]